MEQKDIATKPMKPDSQDGQQSNELGNNQKDAGHAPCSVTVVAPDKQSVKPTHPKAVGGLLQQLAQQPDKYSDIQNLSSSNVTKFNSGYFHEIYQESQGWHHGNWQRSCPFRCELCDVNCTSKLHLQQHMAGRKHLMKSKMEGSACLTDQTANNSATLKQPVAKRAQVQEAFEELAKQEPILGLHMVFEEEYDDILSYTCKLCNLQLMVASITAHVVGWKHRFKYMQIHDFERWKKLNAVNPSGGSKVTGLMRTYANKISHFINGAYKIPKIKVIKHQGLFPFQPKANKKHFIKTVPVQDKIPAVISNEPALMKSRKELELEERERMLNEKEKLLKAKEKEGRERQMQEIKMEIKDMEIKRQEQKNIYREEIHQREMKQTKEEGGLKSQDDLLELICKNEKDKVSIETKSSIQNSESSLSESFVLEALLQDTKDRDAHQETALILKLSAVDRKILYLLMLQRKRFRASLQRLEESISDRPLSSTEILIKTRLESALEKMKSDGRQILSTVLWPESGESQHDKPELRHLASLLKFRYYQDEQEASSSKPTPITKLREAIQTNYSGDQRRNAAYASASLLRSYDSRDVDIPKLPADRDMPQSSKSYDYHHHNPHESNRYQDLYNTQHSSNDRKSEYSRIENHEIRNKYHQRYQIPSRDDPSNSREELWSRSKNTDEETRKMMEDRIFESLCKGSLAPIAKAFSNNPTLQAALKTWEGNMESDRSDTLRDDADVKGHLNTGENYEQTREDESYEEEIPPNEEGREHFNPSSQNPFQYDDQSFVGDEINTHGDYHEAYHEAPSVSGLQRSHENDEYNVSSGVLSREGYDNEPYYHEYHEEEYRESQERISNATRRVRTSIKRVVRRDYHDGSDEPTPKQPLLPSPQVPIRHEENVPLLKHPQHIVRAHRPVQGDVPMLNYPGKLQVQRPLRKKTPFSHQYNHQKRPLFGSPLKGATGLRHAPPRKLVPMSAGRGLLHRPRQPLLRHPTSAPVLVRPGTLVKRKIPLLPGVRPPRPLKRPLLQRPPSLLGQPQ